MTSKNGLKVQLNLIEKKKSEIMCLEVDSMHFFRELQVYELEMSEKGERFRSVVGSKVSEILQQCTGREAEYNSQQLFQ